MTKEELEKGLRKEREDFARLMRTHALDVCEEIDYRLHIQDLEEKLQQMEDDEERKPLFERYRFGNTDPAFLNGALDAIARWYAPSETTYQRIADTLWDDYAGGNLNMETETHYEYTFLLVDEGIETTRYDLTPVGIMAYLHCGLVLTEIRELL